MSKGIRGKGEKGKRERRNGSKFKKKSLKK
jgi:hypothetical protein